MFGSIPTRGEGEKKERETEREKEAHFVLENSGIARERGSRGCSVVYVDTSASVEYVSLHCSFYREGGEEGPE